MTTLGFKSELIAHTTSLCQDITRCHNGLAALPLPAHMQGTSLVPWLNDPATKSRIAVFSTMTATHTGALGHSARNARYRYIEWNGGKDGVQLYDLQTDPHQLTNLAGQEAHLPMQRRLKRLLGEHLEHVSR